MVAALLTALTLSAVGGNIWATNAAADASTTRDEALDASRAVANASTRVTGAACAFVATEDAAWLERFETEPGRNRSEDEAIARLE